MSLLAQNLKHLRNKNNTPIAELLQVCGLRSSSLESYRLYELGLCEPSHETIISLANFYKISIHELCFCDLKNNSTEQISFKKHNINYYTKDEIYSSLLSQPEKLQKHILQLLGLR